MIIQLFSNPQAKLRPENIDELQKWSRKWRISVYDLCQAIVETGSTNLRELKSYIRRKKNMKKHQPKWRVYVRETNSFCQ
jgi:hypothetical protein